MDLNKRSTHDFVDTPYNSLYQVRVRYLLHGIYIDSKWKDLWQKETQRMYHREQIKWKTQENKDLTAEQVQNNYKSHIKDRGLLLEDTEKGNTHPSTLP